ncbi:MAG: Ryanodine receptor Ryr [Sphingobacteriia bacterium]|nr:Ryanodine receptor Ryr [Sphingobacteriia bacterium]NCC39347.1 Ryanodine receptor Ryr [Gammaproteobacteria bacterium]
MHAQDPPPSLPRPHPASRWRLETFAIGDRTARALLTRWPLHLGMDPRFEQAPHLLIVGRAALARPFLLQALRLLHYGAVRPRVTLLCAEEEAVVAELFESYPMASEIADIRGVSLDAWRADDPDGAARPAHDRGVAIWPERMASAPPMPREDCPGLDDSSRPITFVLVCPTPAEGDGLTLAHRLVRALARAQGVSPPVLVEVRGPLADGRIQDWDGQTIPFSVLHEACRPEVLLDGHGDEVARTIHDQYRDSIAAQGRDLGDEPAGQPWDRLETSYRQANRHQADHVWAKLAVIDCRAVSEDLVESFYLTPLEIERLALIEHQRWAADRHLDGWRYAPVRDNQRKHHPQLVPYAELSEPMKDLDRHAVRALPVLLARQGLGILRQLIVGVSVTAEVSPVGRRWRGLVEQLLERLSTRYPDRLLVLALTPDEPAACALARCALERDAGTGLVLLLSRPLCETLEGATDPAARTAILELIARAERRIVLRGESERCDWLARRASISLILGESAAAGPGIKQVRLDPDGGVLQWGFDY